MQRFYISINRNARIKFICIQIKQGKYKFRIWWLDRLYWFNVVHIQWKGYGVFEWIVFASSFNSLLIFVRTLVHKLQLATSNSQCAGLSMYSWTNLINYCSNGIASICNRLKAANIVVHAIVLLYEKFNK